MKLLSDDGVVAPSKRSLPASDREAFRSDCLTGLARSQKSIPAKWLYDETGSHLFDRICEMPDYYPTRVETALLAQAAAELAQSTPHGTTLVELGSGASRKSRILLDATTAFSTYVPVDINPVELARSTAELRREYLGLWVEPIVGDFMRLGDLSRFRQSAPIVVFFPGSTLGNLEYDDAVGLLTSLRAATGDGGSLLLGIDLFKDEKTLLAAYDDAGGVTAAFNLNLLTRLNRELDGDFDRDAFAHRAIWNRTKRRVEMHLQARRALTLRVAGRFFRMEAGETIHTENSHKWSIPQLDTMFTTAGWQVSRRWTDFAPSYLVALLTG